MSAWGAVERWRSNNPITPADVREEVARAERHYDERAEWLAWRRGGVGGSDVAGILDLSPWASPYSIWADKVYGSDDDGETLAQAFGRRAEPMIVPWFHEQTGLYVSGEQTRCTHLEHPHHRCTIDGYVFETPPLYGDDGPVHTSTLGAYEAKTTSATPKEWETDGIPIQYQCQGQWTMHVTGLDHLWFAVLHLAFGRPDLRVYELARDETDIDLIVKAVDAFWNDHVVTVTPPATDGHTATTYATKHLPAAAGDMVDVDETVADLVAARAVAKAQLKALEGQIDIAENAIRAALGDATEGFHQGRLIVSHRPQNRAGLDTDGLRARHPEVFAQFRTESTYRVLRQHTPKKKETKK